MVRFKLNKLNKVALVLSILIISQNVTVFANNQDNLQNQIEQNNLNIDGLQDKSDEINGKIYNQNNELESIVSEIESKSEELNKAKSDVEYYRNLISNVQDEIDEINYEIESLTNEIKIREDVIKQKELEKEKIKVLLDNRIRSYSKIDMTTEIVFMIIESKSLTSFMENVENAYKIIKLDKDLIEAINKVNEEMEAESLKIQGEVSKVEANKTTIVKKQEELLVVQEEVLAREYTEQSKMDELLALENQKSSIISGLSDEESSIASEIGELLIYNEQLQQELNNLFDQINNNNNNNNGQTNNESANGQGFLRPGSGVVTDSFGPRINPVTFEAGAHNGVDFGDAYGDNVYASKSGTVVYSGWISGYGNTIIIDHGSGVQTLYGHNSELLAYVGQEVSQGEVVSRVGSTGMSTGPHIHFEIRINGQPVNPLDYL